MAELWDGTRQRAVHCNGAAPENVTASVVLDWATVTGGTNSLSRYMRLDARSNSVSVRVPIAPGGAHNGKKLKITVHPDDASSNNFRGVVFTGGNPVERGTLATSNIYMLDRRSGHLVLEVVNGVVRINSGASFNADPPTPGNAELLAILNGWTTGATWAVAPDNPNDAFVQFNANGVFNPSRALTAWVLGAAGGGGGGGTVAGGGGAGEFFEDTTFAITAISHALTIGAGGVGGLGWANNGATGHGTDGADTLFGALFNLNGGGGGGTHDGAGFQNGNAGGSGGGGGQATGTGGASTLTGPTGQTPGRFGNAGGAATTQVGAGGGGAGGVGETATSNNAGDGGGERASLITGVSIGYCGGGGGGNRNDITAGGPTGAGSTSGGRGGMDTLTPVAHDGVGAQSTAGVAAMHGRANSGGGGGGAGYSGPSNATIGATGGSGVLIIRVPLIAAIGL